MAVYKTITKIPMLPSYLQCVEYLESTGTQWIDTAIQLGSDNFDIDFMFSFGAYTTAEQPICSIWTSYYNYWNIFVRNDKRLDIYTANHNVYPYLTVSPNTMYSIKFSRIGNQWSFSANDSGNFSWAYSPNIVNNTTLKLYTRGDTIMYQFQRIKIYGFSFYCVNSNSSLVPCRFKTSAQAIDGNTGLLTTYPANKPCMWDSIENKVYVNKGTGDDFIVGPDIELNLYKLITSYKENLRCNTKNLFEPNVVARDRLLTYSDYNGSNVTKFPTVYNGLYYFGGGYGDGQGSCPYIKVESGKTYTISFKIKISDNYPKSEDRGQNVFARVYKDKSTWTLLSTGVYWGTQNQMIYSRETSNIDNAITTFTVTIPQGYEYLTFGMTLYYLLRNFERHYVGCYDIQVEENSTATPFVPFGYLPSYKDDLRVDTRNLANVIYQRGGVNSNVQVLSPNSCIFRSLTSVYGGYVVYVSVKLTTENLWGKTLTISCDVAFTIDNANPLMRIGYWQLYEVGNRWQDFGNKTPINNARNSITVTLPSTPPADYDENESICLFFNVQRNVVDKNVITVTDIQLEENSTATPFVPYKHI